MSRITDWIRRFFSRKEVEPFDPKTNEFVLWLRDETRASEDHRIAMRKQRKRDRERWSNRSAIERELIGGEQ